MDEFIHQPAASTRPPELDALLRKVCIDDPDRPYLATPFGVNLWPPGHWDAAGNGQLLLALQGGHFECRSPISTNALSVLQCAPPPTHTCTMAALREWAGTDNGICLACDGAGVTGTATCKKCDGEGVIYCDLDHEHDCPECDGDGKTGVVCSVCHGRKGRNILEGRIGDFAVNRGLLASVVHDLPGDVVQLGWITTDILHAITLHGPGWRMIFSALSGYTAPDAPRLDVVTIEGTAP